MPASSPSLPAGHVRPSLGYAGLEPIGRIEHERSLRDLKRTAHALVAKRRIDVAHVGRHRPREQKRLLRHVSDLPSQIMLGHIANIDAVDANRARAHIAEPLYEFKDRRFPRSRRADDGKRSACGNGEAHVLENALALIVVTKRHVIENHLGEDRRFPRSRRADDGKRSACGNGEAHVLENALALIVVTKRHVIENHLGAPRAAIGRIGNDAAKLIRRDSRSIA